MSVELLTEHDLELLNLKRGFSLHLSKYHIVGNHISRLNYIVLNQWACRVASMANLLFKML